LSRGLERVAGVKVALARLLSVRVGAVAFREKFGGERVVLVERRGKVRGGFSAAARNGTERSLSSRQEAPTSRQESFSPRPSWSSARRGSASDVTRVVAAEVDDRCSA
jgi:hypothetical protein